MDTMGAIADLSRAAWRKSSFSNGQGGNCIEVGNAGDAIALRDSKDPRGPRLLVSSAAWSKFTGGLKSVSLG